MVASGSEVKLTNLAHAIGAVSFVVESRFRPKLVRQIVDQPAQLGAAQLVVGLLDGRPPMLGASEFETAPSAYAALRHSLDLAANSSGSTRTLQ